MFHLLLFIALFSYCSAATLPHLKIGLRPLPDGRIVGGLETTIEAFPHQASLRYFSWHRCGGSVIKFDVVVTAAHCVDGIPLINMAFVAGTSNVNDGGEVRKLKKRIVHEKYDDWTVDYDVAIILLQNGFDFSERIQPIVLAGSNELLPAGSKVLVSGWGTVKENGAEPDILRYVTMHVIAAEQCSTAYNGVGTITENMVCAGATGGGKDACQGDSGGPLIIGNKLYGIVSWGIGCGRPEYPGVYTKISAMRNWIDNALLQL